MLPAEWMLITAGNMDNYNTMTASWGGLGVLWNLNVATCYIRPQRHTYKYAEEFDYFTLSFFPSEYKKALSYCGAHSGKNVDKAKETGLTPIETENSIAFEQANIILECKKLYSDNLKPDSFIEKLLVDKNYPNSDFHRFYIGEITKAYKK
jgi:flavin reductase (DIM6/NTAB) family NADH-FMN oxidoreductase RutF